MTQDLQKTEEQKPKRTTRLPNWALTLGEVTAYAGTVCAALLTMWSQVREHFSNHIKARDLLGKERLRRNLDTQKVVAGLPVFDDDNRFFLKKIIKPQKPLFEANLPPEEATKATKFLSERFRDGPMKNLLVRLNADSSWKQFNQLKKADQAKVLAVGLTVVSIGLGAIFAVRQNRRVEKQLQDVHDKLEKLDRERNGEQEQQSFSR